MGDNWDLYLDPWQEDDGGPGICAISGNEYMHTNVFAIENDSNGFAPSKQLIYFDMNKPNEIIENGKWKNGETTTIMSNICPPTSATTTSPWNAPCTSMQNLILNGLSADFDGEWEFRGIYDGKPYYSHGNWEAFYSKIRNRYYIVVVEIDYIDWAVSYECDSSYSSIIQCNGNWWRYSDIYQSMIKDLDAEFTSCSLTASPTNPTHGPTINPTLQPIVAELVENDSTFFYILVLTILLIGIMIGCCSAILYANKKKKEEISVQSVRKDSVEKESDADQDVSDNKQNVSLKAGKSEKLCLKESIRLLKLWELEQYIQVLIVREGYEEIEDWKELTFDDLISFGFKQGHAKKFMRKLLDHFEEKDVNDDKEGNEACLYTDYCIQLTLEKMISCEAELMYSSQEQAIIPTLDAETNDGRFTNGVDV